MKNCLKLLLAVGVIALPSAAIAADTFEIDPTHTWVNFSISHGGWSFALGQFRTVSGEITFDEDDAANSSVSVEIAASSIDTNLDERNNTLKSPDFFNSAEFPNISFKSTSIEITGDNTAIITGDLSMIGVSHSVELDTVFNQGDDRTVGFSAFGELTPGDFGMDKVEAFGLGPDVTFTIEVEANK